MNTTLRRTSLKPVPAHSVSDAVTLANDKIDLTGVEALRMQTFVAASYLERSVIFHMPMLGKVTVRLPLDIPPGVQVKVFAQTCGTLIPDSIQVIIFANNTTVWSGCIWQRQGAGY